MTRDEKKVTSQILWVKLRSRLKHLLIKCTLSTLPQVALNFTVFNATFILPYVALVTTFNLFTKHKAVIFKSI